MQIINTYAGGTLAIMDNAEQAAWEAANPAVGDFLINTESLKLVYLDDSGAIVEVNFLGDVYEPQTAYIGPYTGATYVNAALIDAVPQMLFMDGSPRTLVVSSPDPGFEWTFDSATGTIDIGTPFDNNTLIFQYKALTTVIPV